MTIQTLASILVTIQGLICLVSLILNTLLFALFLKKYKTFVKRKSLILSFHIIVGNLFYSLGPNYIYNSLAHMLSGEAESLTDYQCLFDNTIQIFGVVVLSLMVSLLAMERFFYVSLKKDISMKLLYFLIGLCYVYAFTLGYLTWYTKAGRRLSIGGCDMVQSNTEMSFLTWGLIWSLAISLLVTYVCYLLIVKRVIKVCQRNQHYSSGYDDTQDMQREAIKRVSIMILIHFVLSLPAILSLLIPRTSPGNMIFFIISCCFLHAFGITEPIIISFFDSLVKKEIKSIFN